eukprot:scaffold88059_cov42-Phaeocystis_antarctica.AAC.2
MQGDAHTQVHLVRVRVRVRAGCTLTLTLTRCRGRGCTSDAASSDRSMCRNSSMGRGARARAGS